MEGLEFVQGGNGSIFVVDKSDESDHVVLVRLVKVEGKWVVGEV